MSPRIRKLDDQLIDQIAAGEVVERPASVVKELLENALDAGARSIEVFLQDGGRGSIVVRDDGIGMAREDATLAVQRHATSKIRELADLSRLETLGFRGEALPSIASVSRFTLTTREPGAVEGTELSFGDTTPRVRPAGGPAGTKVEVGELFYNVPARRKFLSARQTEAAHIYDTCLRIALSRPALRLSVQSEGRIVRQYLPQDSLLARAHEAFRDSAMQEFVASRDGIDLHAVLSPPERARNGARQLYLFVNDRAIQDRRLARAIAFAYGSVLPPGRYPVGVVQLRMDPARVDVNAHPQKTEVRFQHAPRVMDAVTRMLAAKLGTAAWGRGDGYWDLRLGQPGPVASGTSPVDAAADPWGIGAALTAPRAEEDRADYGLLPQRGFYGSLRMLGQVNKMLLVCEGETGLYIIDQHAADERIRYARLQRTYRNGTVERQRLLFPERIEASAADIALLDKYGSEIDATGFEIDAAGADAVVVRTVPALLSKTSAERLLTDLLGELNRSADRAFSDAIETALATMACHAAVRAGDVLSAAEGERLLQQLDEVDDFAGHCPHGRPVVVELPFADLERRLGR